MAAICNRLDKLSPLRKWTAMDAIDTMPVLVREFAEDGTSAEALLREFMRHVAKVARPYPDAYFVLGQKSDDAVDDLGNRAFSVCASVPKGRFPFSERTPFAAYVEERFDGRTIRYHSFYAKPPSRARSCAMTMPSTCDGSRPPVARRALCRHRRGPEGRLRGGTAGGCPAEVAASSADADASSAGGGDRPAASARDD